MKKYFLCKDCAYFRYNQWEKENYCDNPDCSVGYASTHLKCPNVKYFKLKDKKTTV